MHNTHSLTECVQLIQHNTNVVIDLRHRCVVRFAKVQRHIVWHVVVLVWESRL